MTDKNDVKVSIYVLYDPRDCKIRYIGRTSKKVVKHRLIEHITKAKYYNIYYPGKKESHKVNWINKLLKEGVEPCIKTIATVVGWTESHNLERSIINKYKDTRNLVNSDDRGEGLKNKVVSDEEKLKISNSLKIYYTTNLNNKAKSIEVYDLDGNYITTYKSATEFANILNIVTRKITRVANGEYGRTQIQGYQLKYVGDTRVITKLVKKERKKTFITKKRKPITVINTITGIITKYIGYSYCCETIGIARCTLHKKIRLEKDNFTIKNYKFILDQYKQDELLETPTLERQKEDNQQPSLSSNTFEGSTTNTRLLTSNVEESNGDTSVLQ